MDALMALSAKGSGGGFLIHPCFEMEGFNQIIIFESRGSRFSIYLLDPTRDSSKRLWIRFWESTPGSYRV
jgi:hypothetical protein